MNKECKHGYKYRVRNRDYDGGKFKNYYIEKISLCNGNNHDIRAGSLFYKELSYTPIISFEDIIKCAYLFLENNNYCADIQSNWDYVYDGKSKALGKYIGKNPMITNEFSLSKIMSEEDIRLMKKDEENKWKQSLLNNLFKEDK